MQWIHYLLFLPPTILGFPYFGHKVQNLLRIKKNKTKAIYWGILLIGILFSLFTLSFPIVIYAYSILFFLIYDTILFIIKKCHLVKTIKIVTKLYFKGIPILLASVLLTLYGLQKAMHPIWKEYTINISKPLNRSLQIVLLTDLHLGTGTNQQTVDTIVNEINHQNVDIVILAGDIYDENTKTELKEDAYRKFGNIHSTYGTYYIEGNHDILTEEAKEKWSQNHVMVLDDRYIEINQEFYIVGRKDKKSNRMSLVELMENIDKKKPILLVNHRPDDIDWIRKLEIDLQLSGHTHAGQFFPGNLFMKYGYDKKHHLLVSSGYGNWGLSIRTSIRNEIVKITIQSNNENPR